MNIACKAARAGGAPRKALYRIRWRVLTASHAPSINVLRRRRTRTAKSATPASDETYEFPASASRRRLARGRKESRTMKPSIHEEQRPVIAAGGTLPGTGARFSASDKRLINCRTVDVNQLMPLKY